MLSGATDWSTRWKKNGWKTVNGTEVKNKNEFQKLVKLCDEVDVKWVSCLEPLQVASKETRSAGVGNT